MENCNVNWNRLAIPDSEIFIYALRHTTTRKMMTICMVKYHYPTNIVGN